MATARSDGGKAAFADLMMFLWCFSFPALAPTMFPLGNLRRRRALWSLLSAAALGIAVVAPVAAPAQRFGNALLGLLPAALGSFRDAAASQRASGDTMRMLTQLTQIFSAAASPILALGSLASR
jgi:hypothetical protein